jgi:acyl carrier protein
MARAEKRLARQGKSPSGAPDYIAHRRINMAKDIPTEVKRIIREQLDVDESAIKPEASFIDDLGADSLGLVELVLALEGEFGVEIPDEETQKIRTVKDVIDYIERHPRAAAPAA